MYETTYIITFFHIKKIFIFFYLDLYSILSVFSTSIALQTGGRAVTSSSLMWQRSIDATQWITNQTLLLMNVIVLADKLIAVNKAITGRWINASLILVGVLAFVKTNVTEKLYRERNDVTPTFDRHIWRYMCSVQSVLPVATVYIDFSNGSFWFVSIIWLNVNMLDILMTTARSADAEYNQSCHLT